MQARQAITKRALPWRTQREYNEYLIGDSDIDLRELQANGYYQLHD